MFCIIQVEEHVKDDLEDADHLSLSSDVWTDDFKHNSYLTVTSHFINQEWEMKTYTLSTAMIKGSVTGEALSSSLKASREKFGLLDKTFTMVTDQGSNILKAGRLSNWHHLNCLAHKLNLCISKDGLDSTPAWKDLLSKCCDIIKVFRYKGPDVIAKQQELRYFMEEVEEEDLTYSEGEVGTTSLKRPVKTRWNSICTMVDSILKNRSVVDSLLRDYGKIELLFKSEEVTALEMLHQFLAPFKQVTTALQADLYPTLSQVWPSVCLLMKKCELELIPEPDELPTRPQK